MAEPDKINPNRLGDYLEIMTKAVFQSGISWKVVSSKWPGIVEAFQGFDAETVAGFGEKELDDLTGDTRVIRNRRKLEAIIGNARRMIELDEEFGGFQKYLRSQPDFDATVKDLRKQFKFLGLTGIYFFLHVVGEKVPPHEEIFPDRG
ncbi:MAG: DNA-3-methyladenine glycosylase I [Chloroflexi bacterium]|nr:DNA-3-methyladenine glycosylase I [Chloroflexota bacterium]MCH8868421.1 DNA-3-methyladenine glycosylase I [Chloroflexota bacterium]MCH9038037.1 DNA-3-methyladenine glycosylase I [Chloroflexota bacterium]MCI0771534.1 DNA-3-methyladenine glycosylase I [Chloroflexota bacterium]MCI0841128.1 DNA-3-methyladenine glycosylase I [Chloroflexota bacterium]